jgi:hypothetical protein
MPGKADDRQSGDGASLSVEAEALTQRCGRAASVADQRGNKAFAAEVACAQRMIRCNSDQALLSQDGAMRERSVVSWTCGQIRCSQPAEAGVGYARADASNGKVILTGRELAGRIAATRKGAARVALMTTPPDDAQHAAHESGGWGRHP